MFVLFVDDDSAVREVAAEVIASAGHEVAIAPGEAGAVSRLASREFDVVVTDLCLGDGDGMSLFHRLRRTAPTTDVVLISGHGTIADAVSALKSGVADYLSKPLSCEALVGTLESLAERRRLMREHGRARAADEDTPSAIIGTSPAANRTRERIAAFARSDAPVLVTGESGTGKEIIAREIHDRSARAARPFVVVNCAAVPDALLEAELFGHERGAFTGATSRREGRFQAAHGGTLLLDEVGELTPAAQAKLLRVLQERVVEPLGTNRQVPVDVRVLSATHRNLRERIASGSFRHDLFFRLRVLEIEAVPLRDRRADLAALVEHAIRRHAPAPPPLPAVTPRAWAALAHYPFPGNVRELEHAIEHGLVLAEGGDIDLEHLPADVAGDLHTTGTSVGPGTLAEAMRAFEREYLVRALARAGGQKSLAARSLGISRKNLWEKLRNHGISKRPPGA